MAVLFEYATLNGGERSMLAVLDQLAESDFKFTTIAPPEGPLSAELRKRDIPQRPWRLHDSGGNRRPRGALFADLAELIRDAKADLVHANSLSMGRLLGAAAVDLKVPTAAHVRDIVGLSGAAVADLNRHRLLVAVSRATRDYHAAQGVDEQRMRVIYNGVDCARFSPRPRPGSLRQILGLTDEAFLVLTIGQIGPRKGWDTLAEAAATIQQRRSHVQFVLVGERNSEKEENVDYEQEMRRRFASGAGTGRAHWLGRVEHVEHLMNEADLLVHPARQEPLGRVLLEAAASGLPILATNVGGTPEIIEDGVSGRLIPPNDPSALAAALIELHDDSEQRERLAIAARGRAEQLFSIERAANELADAWRELTAC